MKARVSDGPASGTSHTIFHSINDADHFDNFHYSMNYKTASKMGPLSSEYRFLVHTM